MAGRVGTRRLGLLAVIGLGELNTYIGAKRRQAKLRRPL